MSKDDLDMLMKELTDMEPDLYAPDNVYMNYRVLVSVTENDAGQRRIMIRYGSQYLWFWLALGRTPGPVVPLYTVYMPLAARQNWMLSSVGEITARDIRRSMGHAF